MVEMNENTTIKKTPAKKSITPVQEHAIESVAKTIASGTDAIHEAEEKEQVMLSSKYVNYLEALAKDRDLHIEEKRELNEAISSLERNAEAQRNLINSVHDKNEELQSKLNVIDVESVKVLIPSELIRRQIKDLINDVKSDLMDEVREAKETIKKLNDEDVIDGLEQVTRINDLKNRICDLEDGGDNDRLDDLEYDINDRLTDSEVNDAIGDYMYNNDYLERSDIEDIIDNSLNHVGVISIDSTDYIELKGRVDAITRNRLRNRFKRFLTFLKKVFIPTK